MDEIFTTLFVIYVLCVTTDILFKYHFEYLYSRNLLCNIIVQPQIFY